MAGAGCGTAEGRVERHGASIDKNYVGGYVNKGDSFCYFSRWQSRSLRDLFLALLREILRRSRIKLFM